MKRWIAPVVIVALLTAPSFFAARHLSERRRQESNVRHDAQWFTIALKSGNARAAANYLAQPKMDSATLEEAMRTHASLLLSTDFETAPVTFRSDGPTILAAFDCSGVVTLTFYTEDGGDVWRVADLKSR